MISPCVSRLVTSGKSYETGVGRPDNPKFVLTKQDMTAAKSSQKRISVQHAVLILNSRSSEELF